jgi:hypothetical protein
MAIAMSSPALASPIQSQRVMALLRASTTMQEDRNEGIDDAEEGRPPRDDQSEAYDQGYADGIQRLFALGWVRATRDLG